MLEDLLFMDLEGLRERIRQKLKEKGLRISHAEKLAGIGSTALSQFLNGRTNNPTMETLKSISQVLDLEIEDLINKNQFQKHSDVLKLPWKQEKYLTIISSLINFIKNNEASVSGNEALLVAKNIYCYCYENDEDDINKSLPEWVLKMMTGEKSMSK